LKEEESVITFEIIGWFS